MSLFMSLFVNFLVLFASCVARAVQGKFDRRLMELAAVTMLVFICLYIEAVKVAVKACYSCYEAGRTVRRWWDDFTTSSSPSSSTPAAPCLADVVPVEKKLLAGYTPVGLLCPAPEFNLTPASAPTAPSVADVVAVEKKLLAGYTPLGLFNPSPAPTIHVIPAEQKLLPNFTPAGLLTPASTSDVVAVETESLPVEVVPANLPTRWGTQ
jgi:hypothetical protein